jgi:cytoskeletal protein CcmA (bactofilin family)
MAKGAASSGAVIGASARVRGRVSGDGDLRVEGSIEGDVSLPGGVLVIAEGGSVSAKQIEADTVDIAGTLKGDVRASGAVRILAGAAVKGDIAGESVSLEEGAEFAGRLDADFSLPAELAGGTSGGRRR